MSTSTTLAVLGTVAVGGHGITQPGAVLQVSPRYRVEIPAAGIDEHRIAVSVGNGHDGALAYLTPEQACQLAGALLEATDLYS